MNPLDYWKRFEETGNIYDYLNYTACTSEYATGFSSNDIKEGGSIDGYDTYDRDGTISHANWRL